MEPRTVLVVEDEPSISEMLQTLLEEEGYRVVTAVNGQEGLERLAELVSAQISRNSNHHLSSNLLVLTDVMMPVMDGRQMLKQIRANPAYARIPVIMMSAVDQLAPDPELGQAAFLVKPFELDTLLDIIARILPINKSP